MTVNLISVLLKLITEKQIVQAIVGCFLRLVLGLVVFSFFWILSYLPITYGSGVMAFLLWLQEQKGLIARERERERERRAFLSSLWLSMVEASGF